MNGFQSQIVKHMTIFNQWEIVVVPFPFVDNLNQKPRPTLVLSKYSFNFENGHTILAMITTAKTTTWPSDISIKQLLPTGLTTHSFIRPKIFTIDNRIIKRSIGILGEKDIDNVKNNLSNYI